MEKLNYFKWGWGNVMHDTVLNYAVVGLGVGKAHAEAALNNPKLNLAAVCDIRDDRLEGAEEKYPGAKIVRDFDELCADPSIDALSLAVPSGLHAELAVKALEAGKHVLVEKPIDITVEAALKIKEAAERTGKTVGVAHQNRHNASMIAFRKALEEGLLGQLFLGTFDVKWYRRQSYYENDGGWRGTWEMDGGGSLMNQAVHTVDLMRWLMGPVESVCSNWGIYAHDIKTEDCTASTIRFRSGACGTFVSTTCAYPGVGTGIKLYGTKGSVEADADVLKLWKIDGGDPDDEAEMLETYGGGNAGMTKAGCGLLFGHAKVVDDFADAVLGGRKPAVGVDEAINAVRIVRAVYESAQTGKTVYFDQK